MTSLPRRLLVRVAPALAGLLLLNLPSSIQAQPELVPMDYEALSQMEETADAARHLYWVGRYEEAAEMFQPLCQQTHASIVLYLAERGLCLLAAGQMAAAEDQLTRAAQLGEFFRDVGSEKRALSKYGKEAEKLYRGDPYERATGYLILALLFMDKGDYDNALAACKSGLLSDSDAMENRYDSDYTLLHLAQAKCHLLRGEPGAAQQCFDAARESYGNTHPDVRDLVSDYHAQVELLQMTKKERKRAGSKDKDAAIQERIQALQTQIQSAMGRVDIDAGLQIQGTGDYNTLVVLPQGKVPFKRRSGQEGNLIVFDTTQGEAEPVRIKLDDSDALDEPLSDLADLAYQSTTRGGRRMESILRGQVSFKRTTVTVGRYITEAGQQAGGLEGLAVALLGAAIQGIGGAVSAEADTRSWKTLPGDFEIFSLQLAPGDHKVTFEQYLYFEKRHSFIKSFRITDDQDMAVIFGPPSLMEAYSDQAIKGRANARKRKPRAAPEPTDALAVLVPPPLGFRIIERFPSPDPIKYPRNVAPDPSRMNRILCSTLQQANLYPVALEHHEILKNREKIAAQAAWALQVEPAGLALEMADKQETYQGAFRFSLINVASGGIAFRQENSGTYTSHSLKTSECTAAFYAAFQQALDAFLTAPEVLKVLASSPSPGNLTP